MTPYELTVLIHHYVSPGPFPLSHTELYKETVKQFLDDGIFAKCPEQENGYIVTDLGKAWLSTILKTPVPKLAYIDNKGEVIDDNISGWRGASKIERGNDKKFRDYL